jgi:hypothetical protein
VIARALRRCRIFRRRRQLASLLGPDYLGPWVNLERLDVHWLERALYGDNIVYLFPGESQPLEGRASYVDSLKA